MIPVILFAAAGVAFCYLAWEMYRWLRPRRPETGAVPGWSPATEFSASQYELTPTEMLTHQPPTAAVLADGSAVVLTGQPTEEALSTDTHHAMDLRWELMLAEFGGAFDESATQFDTRMDVIEADFHAKRDNMAQVEADYADVIAELDAALGEPATAGAS